MVNIRERLFGINGKVKPLFLCSCNIVPGKHVLCLLLLLSSDGESNNRNHNTCLSGPMLQPYKNRGFTLHYTTMVGNGQYTGEVIRDKW